MIIMNMKWLQTYLGKISFQEQFEIRSDDTLGHSVDVFESILCSFEGEETDEAELKRRRPRTPPPRGGRSRPP